MDRRGRHHHDRGGPGGRADVLDVQHLGRLGRLPGRHRHQQLPARRRRRTLQRQHGSGEHRVHGRVFRVRRRPRPLEHQRCVCKPAARADADLPGGLRRRQGCRLADPEHADGDLRRHDRGERGRRPVPDAAAPRGNDGRICARAERRADAGDARVRRLFVGRAGRAVHDRRRVRGRGAGACGSAHAGHGHSGNADRHGMVLRARPRCHRPRRARGCDRGRYPRTERRYARDRRHGDAAGADCRDRRRHFGAQWQHHGEQHRHAQRRHDAVGAGRRGDGAARACRRRDAGRARRLDQRAARCDECGRRGLRERRCGHAGQQCDGDARRWQPDRRLRRRCAFAKRPCAQRQGRVGRADR